MSFHSIRWAAVIGCVFIATAGAQAEPTEWNQERVATTAEELAVSIEDIRSSLRNEPTQSIASMQSKARHRLYDNLRLIKNESKHLAREVRDGRSADETLPVYERLQDLVKRAQADGRTVHVTEGTQAKIDAASTRLDELAELYPSTPAVGAADGE